LKVQQDAIIFALSPIFAQAILLSPTLPVEEHCKNGEIQIKTMTICRKYAVFRIYRTFCGKWKIRRFQKPRKLTQNDPQKVLPKAKKWGYITPV